MEVSWVKSNSPYLVRGTKPWSKLRDTEKNRNKNVCFEWCYYNIKDFFSPIHMKSVHQLCLSKKHEKYTCKKCTPYHKEFLWSLWMIQKYFCKEILHAGHLQALMGLRNLPWQLQVMLLPLNIGEAMHNHRQP